MATDSFSGSGALSADWTAISTALPKTPITQSGGYAQLAGVWSGPAGVYHSSALDDCQALIGTSAAWGPFAAKRVAVRAGADQRGYELFYHSGVGNTTIDYARLFKSGGELGTPVQVALPSSFDCSTTTGTLRVACSGTTTVTIKIYHNGSQLGGDITDSSSPLAAGHPGLIWNAENGTPANSYIDNWTDNASAGGVSKPIAMHHYRAMHMA
jgi:hypothetical protein